VRVPRWRSRSLRLARAGEDGAGLVDGAEQIKPAAPKFGANQNFGGCHFASLVSRNSLLALERASFAPRLAAASSIRQPGGGGSWRSGQLAPARERRR